MKKLGFILSILLLISTLSKAQTTEAKFKTSAICGQCKKRIERDLAFEKGVISSNLDVKTKMVTVVYKSKKTNPEKLKKAISKIGYSADDVLADEKAFNKLPECCQREVEGDTD